MRSDSAGRAWPLLVPLLLVSGSISFCDPLQVPSYRGQPPNCSISSAAPVQTVDILHLLHVSSPVSSIVLVFGELSGSELPTRVLLGSIDSIDQNFRFYDGRGTIDHPADRLSRSVFSSEDGGRPRCTFILFSGSWMVTTGIITSSIDHLIRR